MSTILLLILIASVAFVASQSDEEMAIPPAGMKYTHMFQTNFTVTVVGVTPSTGGGQKDLKRFGKYLLKRTNAHQLKAEDKDTSDEPDLLVFDIEMLGQYVNFDSSGNGDEIWYNVITVLASSICVNENCPADSQLIPGTQSQRQLFHRHLETAGNIAEDLKNRLLRSGQEYFANITCVRMVSDESSGCDIVPSYIGMPNEV